MNTENPLQDIMPRYAWLECRAHELARALAEYTASHTHFEENLLLLQGWARELAEILAAIEAENRHRARRGHS